MSQQTIISTTFGDGATIGSKGFNYYLEIAQQIIISITFGDGSTIGNKGY